MTIEIGVVSEADRQAALAALIEHAADPDEPGAWIAETAARLMRKAANSDGQSSGVLDHSLTNQ